MTTGYALQSIVLNGATLTGLRSMGIDPRETQINLGSAGTLHRTLASVRRAAPIVPFSTVGLAEILALLTNTDAPMVNITANADLVFAKQNPNAPGYDSTGHIGRRIASGQVYLNGVRWSAGGDGAEADCTIFAVSADGTTNPVASASISLPTAVPVEVYTLTALTLGGQSIVKTQSLEISIAHQAENNVDICYDLGLPYPKMVLTAGAAGPIAIDGTLETTDQNVTPTATGTLVAVFTKYAPGGTLGADTKTFTLNNAMIREMPRSAQQGSPATRRFQITSTYNGTTKPLTIS